MLNIPNLLTLFRILLVPIFVYVFITTNSKTLVYSIIIFLLAGLTDILDGYIARKYKMITKLGMMLDPLADKLMLLTVLSCLALYKIIPFWVLIVITLKELFMIAAGMFLYKKDTVIPSNIFGKLSTVLFYISIFMFCYSRNLAVYMLYVSVISALIALINYLIIYNKKHR